MEELEGQLAELYSAYVTELRAVIDEVTPWWTALRATLGRGPLELRWIGGLASHPRVLAVYRDYHSQLTQLRQPLPEGPTPRFDEDAAWGSDAEAEPTTLLPPEPEAVLIDRLWVEAPELHPTMVQLVMPPIGLALDPEPTVATLATRHEIEVERAWQTFEFEHRHGVDRGLVRLLGAGLDLRPRGIPNQTLATASQLHRVSFGAYLGDLEQALSEVEGWWNNELVHREQLGLTIEQAHEELMVEFMFGPVGHPRILGVIQRYWAICHEINLILPEPGQRVAPEQMLLGWLQEDRFITWVEVLSAMPYWPVALHREGSWS